MANQEHLNILKQGAAAWTFWRSHNPKIQPDLSKANLYGNDYLHGIDLSHVNMSGTNLISAYLSGTNLAGADLTNAYLSQANLTAANLSGANLSGAVRREVT